MDLKIKNLLALIIIIFVFLALYQNFPRNEVSPDTLPIKGDLDNYVVLSNKRIDLVGGSPITYLELIASIGVTFSNWQRTSLNSTWLEDINQNARQSTWLSGVNIRQIDENSLITVADALELFIKAAHANAQDRLPSNLEYYRESLSQVVSINQNHSSFNYLLNAYTLGLLPFDFNYNDLNANLTKQQTYEILNALVYDHNKHIPVLILEDSHQLEISNYQVPTGTYYAGDQIDFSAEIVNNDNSEVSIWAGISYQNAAGKWHDIPAKHIKVSSKGTENIEFHWQIPDKLMSGHYRFVFSLWDESPGSVNSTRLTYLEAVDLIRIYNKQEDFEFLDFSLWKSSTHKLGRTTFNPNYVKVEDGKLKLIMPAHSFDSGELQSRELMGYGSYEIRMKLPNAPGSITGFFMYKAPDYYFEIDIEIYNQKSGDYFLTTYANGAKRNEYFGVFPFDPTTSFNNYRFDYYPDRLDYFVNDQFIVRFTAGYPHEPMYLMVNSWYPNWVEGGPADRDLEFLAEWIKY